MEKDYKLKINKKLVYVSIFIMCSLLLGVFSYGYSVMGLRLNEDKCSKEVIEKHILSLTQNYTEEEKEQLAIEIKQWLIEKGEC